MSFVLMLYLLVKTILRPRFSSFDIKLAVVLYSNSPYKYSFLETIAGASIGLSFPVYLPEARASLLDFSIGEGK